MSSWTDETKAEAIQKYQDAEPTPENSMEIVKEIAEEMSQSANGVRMILTQAGVYVKKEAAKTSTTAAKSGGDKPARVSKEDAQSRLNSAIEAAGGEVNSEITSKLTGKAAIYLAEVLEKANAGSDED